VPIRLPGRVAKGAENCVEITVALDEKTLVQLIQVGLAARGFDPGLADGVPGPRTRAAIAAFAEKSGQEIDPSDPAAVYRALFGTAPGREKGGAGNKACVPMKVENPPASAPAPPAPAAPAASPDETSQRPTIHLGVNVGDGENRDGEGRGGNDKPGLHITLPGLGGLFNK
jgi:peptidoglycan hydrolase-like protein with peptidoglycan-binding domain